MEVYAVTREFAEWGKGFYNRLPAAVRNGLRAAGVCHYLVVVRQPEDGRLWMFDFGPVGGDVTGMMAGGVRPDVSRTPMDAVRSSMRRSASAPGLLRSASARAASVDLGDLPEAAHDDGGASGAPTAVGALRRSSTVHRRLREKNVVPGEIREQALDALPEGSHFVGHTTLSIEDIRTFNARRSTAYTLHDNDCRHYVNELCAHACPEAAAAHPRGVASKVTWNSTWGRVRGGRPHEALYAIPIQFVADVSNVNTLDRIKSACGASVVFGLGMRALPILCRPVAPILGAAMPARRLATAAAGAVAGVSAEAPVVREALYVGNAAIGGVVDITRGLANLFAGTGGLSTRAVRAAGASASAVAGEIGAAGASASAVAGEIGAAAAAAGEMATASVASISEMALAQEMAAGAASATATAGEMAAGAVKFAEGAGASLAVGAAAGAAAASGRETTNRVRLFAGRVGRAAVNGLKRVVSPVRPRERPRQARRMSPRGNGDSRSRSGSFSRENSRGSLDSLSSRTSTESLSSGEPRPTRRLRFLGGEPGENVPRKVRARRLFSLPRRRDAVGGGA